MIDNHRVFLRLIIDNLGVYKVNNRDLCGSSELMIDNHGGFQGLNRELWVFFKVDNREPFRSSEKHEFLGLTIENPGVLQG